MENKMVRPLNVVNVTVYTENQDDEKSDILLCCVQNHRRLYPDYKKETSKN